MVAALWSNPNWDDTKESKGHRSNAISGINEDFEEALAAVDVALDGRAVPEEEKLDKTNPFFAAAERGLERVDQRIKQLQPEGSKQQRDSEKPEEAIDMMKDIDQD